MDKRRVLMALWLVGLLTVIGRWPGVAQTTGQTTRPTRTGEWMRDWLLCGPFPLATLPNNTPDGVHIPGFEKDYLAALGGERNPRVQEGATVEYEGGRATWIAHRAAGSSIDLDRAVSEKAFVLAYAYREFDWPRDQTMVLALGSNDGGRGWLNGDLVWDRPEARGLKVDDELILVRLRKGRNRLVLKIEERGNRWEFCARLLPFRISLLEQGRPLYRVVNRADGTATLRFEHPVTAVDQLFEKMVLTIVRASEPEKIVWQGDWTRQAEMRLPVEAAKFEHYRLRVEGRLAAEEPQWWDETPFSAGRRVEQTLFADGRTDYAIVTGRAAGESEQWAARELQHWLKQVSGADFPLRKADEVTGERVIVVGYNEQTRRLAGASVTEPAAGDESFRYWNNGPTLLILGGRERGTMYGVMSFLERELGCRWYTPRVSLAPARARYAFTRLDHREAPGVRVRNNFYYEAFDPVWAARNRMNGAMGHRQQPGGVEAYWNVHTFYQFVPPEEFFASHPEYFSLLDGKRTWERAQLCLTNPDVRRIITERLRERMRQSPEYLIYCVSQNDWLNPCECDHCQEIARREGSEAGPMIWFVNQVAEAVEKEFPGKYVGTLAYQYTRKPPRTLRPRANVVTRLCSIEACFAHDFRNCPVNKPFVDDLEGWARIAPQLYIWDYVVNFSHYIMPFPNFRVLQPNIQTLRANKSIGIMEQAAYQSPGGEFAELRAWVLGRLLWNPDGHLEDYLNDFLLGYYGRAGQYVRGYLELIHSRLNAETHIHLGLRPDDQIFSEELVREADGLFDRAEAVADNDEVRRRVELARLPLLYLKCLRAPITAKYDGTYERFRTIVEREGITHFAESGRPHREAFFQKMESTK